MQDNDKTNPKPPAFDFEAFPKDSLFHDRREGRDRRYLKAPEFKPREVETPTIPPERRAKKERRRRIDPTTFEKQYTDDELEFMNAMQKFKDQSGKQFPSHGEVLRVAFALGYRKFITEYDDDPCDHLDDSEPGLASDER